MEMIFHENVLAESGTSIALYDYAYYCREYLDIYPIIAVPKSEKNVSLNKFKKQFEVIEYTDKNEIQKIIDHRSIQNFYAIKFGVKDDLEFKNCRNLIHAVFYCQYGHFHGDVYAFVSEYMSLYKDNNIPYVPHMVNLPDHDKNLRERLSIPSDATVLGRYGSFETFNIDFVKQTINEIVEERKDIYFLFANTPVFFKHPQIIYLPMIIDLDKKVEFINSCDAMIHARDYGETFGLSTLEFACKNKQIISYDNPELQNSHILGGRNHFLYLKEKNCFKYKNKEDLIYIFRNITQKNPFDTTYLNEDFSPLNVTKKFKEVFL